MAKIEKRQDPGKRIARELRLVEATPDDIDAYLYRHVKTVKDARSVLKDTLLIVQHLLKQQERKQ